MPRSVGLVQAWGQIGLNGRTVLTSVSGASVLICNQGTSTPISETIYADASSGTTLTNPLTTDVTGTKQFYLEDPKLVTLIKTASGYTFPNEDILVGEPGSSSVAALDDLSDMVITSPTTSSQLGYNGTTWVNHKNVYNVKLFGALGDGTTDDSTAINAASTAAAVTGGTVYFPPTTGRVYLVKNGNVLTDTTWDLGGNVLTLPSTATTADDVLRSNGFATHTGTTHQASDGAPYRIKICNGTIDTGSGNLGRHSLAMYASAVRLENLIIVNRGKGGLWSEYGYSGENWSAGSPDDYRFSEDAWSIENVVIVDGLLFNTLDATTAPAANDMSLTVTGVTNTTNPTITTSRPHWLHNGMTVTIASVVGSTGVNGTFTVLSAASATTFTVTAAAPGAYVSGGTVTYHVSAAWTHMVHDSRVNAVVVIGGVFIRGRRGILCGKDAGLGATGTNFTNTHIYLHFDVGLEVRSGNVAMPVGNQIEAGYMCNVHAATGSNYSSLAGAVFAGRTGTTAVSLRDADHLRVDFLVEKLGGDSGAAASNSNIDYTPAQVIGLETYSADWITGHFSMLEGVAATTLIPTSGTQPTDSDMELYFNAFSPSTITESGWVPLTNGSNGAVGTAAAVIRRKLSSAASAAIASSGTITVNNQDTIRVNPAGAVTGIIMTAGAVGGQHTTIINESSFSITFAAAGTSRVADGTSAVIAALTKKDFTWDVTASRWFHN